jgi:cytochrome c553
MTESKRAHNAVKRRRLLVRVVIAAAAALLLGALVVASGIVPVPASSGHWAVTNWLLHFAMQRSVATHSRGVETPDIGGDRRLLVGAGHYETGCRFCHGAPGQRMPRVPQASTPHPPALAMQLERYDAAELFYIVRHGIKFTGMPAWPAPLREDEVWSVVAFLRVLPRLSAEDYRTLVQGPAELYAADAPQVVLTRCARCHGAHGRGRGEGAFPSLAGQKPLYLSQSMEAYARGSRHSGIMEPVAAELTPSELEQVVDWYARQPGASPRVFARASDLAARDGRIPLCESCHADADQRHAAFPRLTDQHPAYLEQQLELLADGRRGGGPYFELMKTVVHWLEPRQRRALAEHFGCSADCQDPD